MMYFLSTKTVVSRLSKSADPYEMPRYATFRLGPHCLPYYMFTGIYNEKN